MFRVLLVERKQVLSATHLLFPWLLAPVLPLLLHLLVMQASSELHQGPGMTENSHFARLFFRQLGCLLRVQGTNTCICTTEMEKRE